MGFAVPTKNMSTSVSVALKLNTDVKKANTSPKVLGSHRHALLAKRFWRWQFQLFPHDRDD